MKAPSSDDEDASEDEGADKDFELDYEDFFSVLMYYYGMSKEDIMNRSKLFLLGLFKQYWKRACENLGVSPDKDKDGDSDNGPIKDSDYPSEFVRLSPKERKKAAEEFKDTADFMRQFGGFSAERIGGGVSVDKH